MGNAPTVGWDKVVNGRTVPEEFLEPCTRNKTSGQLVHLNTAPGAHRSREGNIPLPDCGPRVLVLGNPPNVINLPARTTGIPCSGAIGRRPPEYHTYQRGIGCRVSSDSLGSTVLLCWRKSTASAICPIAPISPHVVPAETMENVATRVAGERIEQVQQEMGTRTGQIETLLEQLRWRMPDERPTSVRSARTSQSDRSQAHHAPTPWYKELYTGREATTQIGPVEMRTGSPAIPIELHQEFPNNRPDAPITIQQDGWNASNDNKVERELDDQLLVTEIVEEPEATGYEYPPEQSESREQPPPRRGYALREQFTPVTPLQSAMREQGWQDKQRRQEIHWPSYRGPADDRRVSTRGMVDMDNPLPHSTPAQQAGFCRAYEMRTPVCTPIAGAHGPHSQQRGATNPRTPVAPRATVTPARVPRVAGFPLGAVPTDSIPQTVITALQAHAQDPDVQRMLGKMGIKIDAPGTYNSDSKLKVFEQWVSGMIRWFRLQSLLGPGEDNNRVNLLGYYCKGPAKDWFQHTVENSEYSPEGWNTLEVIPGLQSRFITQKSAAEAAHEFRTVQQGNKDALKLYQELKFLSTQVPVPTDPYTFAHHFMEALNPSISKRVMANGYSAEVDEIELLVRVAMDTEMTMQAVPQFKETRPSGSSGVNGCRDRDHTGKGRSSSERNDQQTPRVSNSNSAPAVPSGTRQSRDSRMKARLSKDGSVICYHCNKPGHIAPNCPTRVSVKAAEVS